MIIADNVKRRAMKKNHVEARPTIALIPLDKICQPNPFRLSRCYYFKDVTVLISNTCEEENIKREI